MSEARALPRSLIQEGTGAGVRHGLRSVLGATAWAQLPDAVRERFADATAPTTYAAGFEMVRASWLGLAFAWLGTMFGMPVTPRTGFNIGSRVHVRPNADGVIWEREYLWPDGGRHVVRSTK